MQLKEINRFSSHLEGLSQDRHARSNSSYEAGLEAFNQAHASRFTDQAALLTASQKLMEALQQNRKDARPYVALALLWILLGDEPQGKRYLIESLKLEPDNPTALDLLKGIEEAKHIQLSADQQLAIFTETQQFTQTKDYDSLYDELQKLIVSSIRQLMTHPHNPRPSLEPNEQAEFGAQFAALKTLHEKIRRQIQVIEVEIDTSDLQQQLKPMEILMRRYQKAEQQGQTFGAIQDKLAHLNQQLVRFFAQPAQVQSDALNAFLDDCDWVADQLDALSGQKVDTHAFEEIYEKCVARFGHLQEVLDEL